MLQKDINLPKYISPLGSEEIMKRLEAITCQWQGLKLTVYGTRFISKDHLITYRKGSFAVPKEETHAASFARVLTAVLSLRRLVYSNYTKLNIILEAKYAHGLETMYFSSDDETNFRSDSAAGLEHQEEIQTIDAQTSSCRIIDAELETHIIQALCDIKSEADVVTFKDWEEFIMERTSKKRKATSSN
ncbi:unnamed protein product [Mucor circinelloides]